MTSRDFCYWLQGFMEIRSQEHGNPQPVALSPNQVEVIGRHLSLVFKHEIDPSFPAEQQAELNKIHRPPSNYDDQMIRC